MPRKNSVVTIAGKVVDIDSEKRDVVIRTRGNDDEAVDVTVHFWTTFEDNHGAWRSDDNWREYVFLDSFMRVDGYLGNHGRVVVAPYHAYVSQDQASENSVQCVGSKAGDTRILTQTPGGKLVYVDVENASTIESIEDGTYLALVGRKTKDKISVLAARPVTNFSLSDSF